MNTTPQAVFLLLRSKNNPRLSSLRKLARAYEVSIDELAQNYDDPDLNPDRDVN